MSKRGGTLLQRFRVPLGFLFAAVFLIFARPQFWTLVIGGIIAFTGILIRAWSAGHIRKNLELAVSGPYAYTRNPLYLGSFMLGVGFTVAAGVWWLALIFIALYLGIYLPVMRVESHELTTIFGEKFHEYARAVPLFFPRLTAGKKSDTKFDFQLYLRYREYRAALGWLFALAILAAKTFYPG
ncbi:MAG: methyltransferase family protein [Pyrinomonadaceae bacterium]